MAIPETITRPPAGSAPPEADSPARTGEPPVEAALEQNAVTGLGVLGQGIAAAAPSVAIASVPASLFFIAGKGALWAAVIGGLLVVLVANVIAFQARRTVSSGSLGTYAGNGLGSGVAFVTGWALVLGYVGFAAAGVIGAVLYFNSFFQELGLGTGHLAVKLLLLTLATAAAVWIPFRGVSLSVKSGLGVELFGLATIAIVIIGSYITYGFAIDGEQFALSHITANGTIVAAVIAVGAYAGFESAAALGHEAKDAHVSVPRALLRIVLGLLGIYLIATYASVLGFQGPNELGADSTPLPVIASNVGADWAIWLIDLALGAAFIVFSAAVINAGARSLFTLSRERALPASLGRVHEQHKTPYVAIALVGAIAFILGLIGTISSVGRFQWDVYVGITSSYAYLVAYLVVSIATPPWLYRIKALRPVHVVVSALAAVGIAYVIFKNFADAEGDYAYLPWVFLGLLLLGVAQYAYLRVKKPEVAERVGTIQTLSEAEQERLAELGILDAVRGSHLADQAVDDLVESGHSR